MNDRQILHQTPVPMMILDCETWRPLEFNTLAAEYLGYRREEFSRLTITDFEMVPNPEETRAHIHAIRRVRHDEFPAVHRAKDGSARRVHVALNMVNWLGRDAMLTVWRDHSGALPATSLPGGAGRTGDDFERPIVAESTAMRRVLARADRVAGADLSVLIRGETGTGKELIARWIHARSRRADRVFMPVNCGALPRELADVELFGAERGAYTGAERRRRGRFQIADGGTIFLDEIGELEPGLQARLLRVLQDGELHPIGAERPTSVDVRVIAATHRDLASMVARREFREDLFYRLNACTIEIPPLRERVEDIRGIVARGLEEARRRTGRAIEALGPADMLRIEQHAWPGNARELLNTLQRALLFSDGDMPVLELSPSVFLPTPGGTATMRLDAALRRHLLAVLDSCNWRIEGAHGAAERLGLRPSTLRSQLRRLGIRRPE